jgi:3-deoxy-D-manno-octulosonic-acid transferase
MLSSIYKYGKIAFIGGGFRGALHNSLEAAVWDIPIIYGYHKNNRKFIEVEKLEKKGIGFPIKNGNEFKLIKNRIFKNRDIGKGGNEFIKNNSGATEKIKDYLTKYLK